MIKTIIIAEVGINHNGNYKLAKKYIDHCKLINVDIVKFQIAIPEKVVLENTKKAKYQKINKQDNETQLQMIKKLHLSIDEYKKLIDYANFKNIEIMFSAFDNESLDIILKSKLIKRIKIPSGEITNRPYLEKISSFRKEIILSTGMSNMIEIKNAIKILKDNKLTLMHCTSNYPTKFSDVNLNVIDYFKQKFKYSIGYSDHTKGFEVPIAAVVKGASIIEKHITFNQNQKGPDHKASMNIHDFSKMISMIRNIELSFGNKKKILTNSERSNKLIVRKSIFAKTDIKKGDTLSYKNLCIMRPGTGCSPMSINKFLGKKSKFNFKENDKIK